MPIKITYEYYFGSGSRKKPWMHENLEAAIMQTAMELQLDRLHIVHLGTTASLTHYKRNPKSKHSGDPPTPPPQEHPSKAIDVVKVYGKKDNEPVIALDFRNDLMARRIAADFWKRVIGGKCYHTRDRGKKHQHFEVA